MKQDKQQRVATGQQSEAKGQLGANQSQPPTAQGGLGDESSLSRIDGTGPKRAIVIGGGFGGLAMAIRLQARGFQVTLLEKNPSLGGKAGRIQEKGYTFDMGPSLVTAPDIIRRLFDSAGMNMAERLPMLPLDPFYRIYFHDGTFLDYNGNSDSMKEQMARFNRKDAEAYDRFMEATRPIYEAVIESGMGGTPFTSIKRMFEFAPTAIKLKALFPATTFANRFFSDWRHRFAFSFHPLYIGGHPFRVPAIYMMIPYLERKQGVWYTPGGMHSMVQAFEKAFLELGGVVRTHCEAKRIVVESGRAKGVEIQGDYLPCDLVVSNADVGHTYRHLIAPSARRKWSDRKVDNLPYSMSCFLLYLGVRRRHPRLMHHTLILAERYKGLIDDIFDKKILPNDFSLYLHAPTRTDDSMAPPGCESIYVLAPVTNLRSGIDWESTKDVFASRILDFLENWGLKDLRRDLDVLRIFTPQDFLEQQNSMFGNAFSIEPKITQTGWFRPQNRSEDIPNLYLTGAGTHPGPGVPGVLLSAEATETCILEDFPQLALHSRMPSTASAFAAEATTGATTGPSTGLAAG